MRNNYKNNHRIIILFLSITIALSIIFVATSGCAAKKDGKTKLKVLSLPYIAYGTFFIAQEEGYFAEEGLEVEFVKLSTTPQAIPLLAQGELDVGAGSVNASLINAIVSSANIKIVAGRDIIRPEGPGTKLLVNKELYDSGEFDELSEIKGKKVAIPSIGSLQHYILSEYLKQVGLTLNDVEIAIMNPQESIAAFETQAITAAMLGQTQSFQAEEIGSAVPIDPLHPVMSGFQQGFVYFGPTLLENNPEAGEKFLRAYLKGCRTYMEGLTERNIEIMLQYTGMERDDFLEAATPNPVFPDGKIIVDDVMAFQQWLYDIGLIDTLLSPSELIDETPLNKALESLEK